MAEQDMSRTYEVTREAVASVYIGRAMVQTALEEARTVLVERASGVLGVIRGLLAEGEPAVAGDGEQQRLAEGYVASELSIAEQEIHDALEHRQSYNEALRIGKNRLGTGHNAAFVALERRAQRADWTLRLNLFVAGMATYRGLSDGQHEPYVASYDDALHYWQLVQLVYPDVGSGQVPDAESRLQHIGLGTDAIEYLLLYYPRAES